MLQENKDKLKELGVEKIGLAYNGDKINIIIDFGDNAESFEKIGGVMMILGEIFEDANEEIGILTTDMLHDDLKIEYI